MLLRLVLFLLLLCAPTFAQNILLKNAVIYDGSGSAPTRGDVRVAGDSIVDIGADLKAREGEAVRDLKGMALAPGFIDMHSHGDRGLFDYLSADTVARQGVTTILVGQDGGSMFPLADFFGRLEKTPAAVNIASMVGHGTLRREVMGNDLLRAATPQEVAKLRELLQREMLAGALGLSTGLEYDPAHFSTTDEVVELAKVAAAAGGFYLSHVRDEGNKVFESFAEIIEIGRRATIPVQISHIKLGTTPVWHLAARRMPAIFAEAEKQGVDLKADVYPYTYWQSTIRVIILDRDYFNPEKVAKAIEENGGAERMIVTRYGPEPELAGKTLAQFALAWNVTPVEAYMRIVRATMPTDEKPRGGEETVIVESMLEDDLKWFMAHPRIMFSSDGELKGRHPRGAGAFPRILGRYAREQKVLPLAEAIRKMTSLPAAQLRVQDRGRIAEGYKADLVVFDPERVIDRSTVQEPLAPPEGIVAVMVNGEWAVEDGKVTEARAGRVLRRASQR
jgi:N-acyl-D-amino-acid deacylase